MSEKSGALAQCDNEQMFKQCPLACVWMYERLCVCTGGFKANPMFWRLGTHREHRTVEHTMNPQSKTIAQDLQQRESEEKKEQKSGETG